MPTDENLTITVNRKVQLEQFEPITFGGTLEVSLEEGDDKDEVYEEKSDELAAMVDKALTKRAVDTKLMADMEDE